MSELDVIQGFFKKEQKDKIDKYRILNETVVKGQILFTGSSLMEQFPINELLMTEKMDYIIYNRGVGGFTTDDMLENMFRCLVQSRLRFLLILEQMILVIRRFLLRKHLHIP